MSDPHPRVADRIARVLKRSGVTHAFGMPGGEVITLLDALEGAGVHFVLARNETAAAMMAAGCCALREGPGLLVTTLGPGLANALNGIADAWQERVPLIVISGVVERSLRARYTHQIVDHPALLAPFVKGSFEIEPQGAEATVARAVRLALAHPRGPVHLDLSPQVAADRTCHASAPVVPMNVAYPRPDAKDPALNELRARLARAQRPLIIAGYEAARCAAVSIAAIAQTHLIPVVTTYKAKGVINEDHPASLGAVGLSPAADAILLPLVRRADLILCAGYDPIEMRPGWLEPVDAARMVEIGAANDHGMYESSLRIDGPIAASLEALFGTHAPQTVWCDGEIAQTRAALRALVRVAPGWGPGVIFDTLQNFVSPDVTLTVDSGAHRILFSQQWRARRPLEVLQSAGWCTMGSALPLAIGAKLAHPERETIAVLGDGGFEMTMGECGTLRDQGLRVSVVVLQDEGLELIALKQDKLRLERRGVAMGATDYAAVARAFGGVGANVDSVADLRAALLEARARPIFSVIACRIGAGAYNEII